MKCKIVIDPTCEEQVVVTARKRSKLVCEIEQLVENNAQYLKGYADDEIKRFSLDQVQCFFIENDKVFALLSKEKLQLKSRLFEIEPLLNESFVKINQSCIANVKHVKKFRASFNGSVMVVFSNGHFDYIARRELKKVKEKFGGF